jgi:hypothetical protein
MVNSTVFWYVTPCCPVGINRLPRGTYCFHLQGRRVSQVNNKQDLCLMLALLLEVCFTYSSIMKIETVRSSETLVNIYQITRCYIP